MLDFDYSRRLMVDRQLKARGIDDPHVLAAMGAVPREVFVPEKLHPFAYDDGPLPIGEGQTISQPYIVADMIAKARVAPGDRVLEIGTGSGYAAAVISRIAASLVTVERHAALAETARERLSALGCNNVEVLVADGSKGAADHAPFDVIIVAAAGPSIPVSLKAQLGVGGRLVMPVATDGPHQRLVRVTRIDTGRYQEEDIGAVLFVPLIGAEGWTDQDAASPLGARASTLADRIAAAIEPLPAIEDENFAAAFDRFGDRRVVLLGEASHGTSEFYRARAAITRRLIERHGFSIVAVEADWPDAAAINRYVRGLAKREGEPAPFQRFPVWMWRNRETADFLAWLREHNAARSSAQQAGLYGLDLYNMTASMAAVIAYLEDVDPQAAAVARERYGCLAPWQAMPAAYGRAALHSGYRDCEDAVVNQCRELLARQFGHAGNDGEAFLDATQNARLVAAAEKYYRVMYHGGAAAWNLRDRHMFETLEHVLEAQGKDARAVVWAHNSHIGDARQTAMGRERGEINIGQLCRERFGTDAALIGFGTHSGTVAAASDWDGEMDVKPVRPSLDQSVERCFHLSGEPRGLIDFAQHEALAAELAEERLERFIGVIYRPETERHSHYMEASLSRQFDAYLWFDETVAVTPLKTGARGRGVPETFPFGL